MKTNKQRKTLVSLFLSLSVIAGCNTFSSNQMIVKADEVVIAEDKEIASQENYQEIRKLVDQSVLTDCEWVEAVIEQNSILIGSPLWFSCTEGEWNIPTTGLENGTYVVKLYRVAADQVSHAVDQEVLSSIEFVISESEPEPDILSGLSVEAKSTVGTEYGKPTITVKLAGAENNSNIKFSRSLAKRYF